MESFQEVRIVSYRLVEEYYRREHFEFFRGHRNPFYSLTFSLEISRLKAFLDEKSYPTYLNLCYFFIKAMQGLEDFRYRLRDDHIVLYEQLNVGLTLPAPQGRFRFGYYRFHPDTATFNTQGEWKQPVEGDPCFLQEAKSEDFVYFTALPKVAFTSFSHVSNQPTETVPQVAFGKFTLRDGRLEVPVGLQVNHIFIDGAAVGELVERAQEFFDHPE